MKKLLSLLVVSGMLMSMTGCVTKTSSTTSGSYDNSYCVNGKPSAFLTQLRKKGVLTVGSSGDEPFAYMDQSSNTFKGVDADIIKYVAKKLGIKKVVMKNITFSELIINLQKGNIDMVTDGMYINAERTKKAYFGDIWYKEGAGLLVSKTSGIKDISDFNPKTTVVGYTPGTAFQNLVESWAKKGLIKEARSTGDQSESITALKYGKINAFVTDTIVLENLFTNEKSAVAGLKLAENYKSDSSVEGSIAPSVALKNKAFMKEVNNVIKEMRSDGTLDKYMKANGLNPELHKVAQKDADSGLNMK